MRTAHTCGAPATQSLPSGLLLNISILIYLILIGAIIQIAQGQVVAQTQQAEESTSNVKSAPLPVGAVVENLERRNALRAAALTQFEGTRIYRATYRGFPSDHDAEMVVHLSFHAPNSKEFTVVSQTGSKFVGDRVFKKLLEGELEAANEENRRRSALSTENYDFAMAGYETSADGGRYVLSLIPKMKNRFLYRGKIWVDATDFAVVRIEGEPGKNPSFWIKKTDIVHRYVKVDDFWLPAENHSESTLRLGGKAVLSIEYRDYKILEAKSLSQARGSQAVAIVGSH